MSNDIENKLEEINIKLEFLENMVIKLFNPYHSKANGQFTSKSGGGGSASSGSEKPKSSKVSVGTKGFSRKNSAVFGVKEGVKAAFTATTTKRLEKVRGGTKSQRKQRQVGRVIGYVGTLAAVGAATYVVANKLTS